MTGGLLPLKHKQKDSGVFVHLKNDCDKMQQLLWDFGTEICFQYYVTVVH